MRTLRRNKGYVNARFLMFAGVVWAIASTIAVVVMWFVRMLIYD